MHELLLSQTEALRKRGTQLLAVRKQLIQIKEETAQDMVQRKDIYENHCVKEMGKKVACHLNRTKRKIADLEEELDGDRTPDDSDAGSRKDDESDHGDQEHGLEEADKAGGGAGAGTPPEGARGGAGAPVKAEQQDPQMAGIPVLKRKKKR